MSISNKEPIMNRMAWITAPGKVELRSKALPPLSSEEVRIRIKASAICGSDLHLFKGRHPSVQLPSAIGHECAGVVEAVGSEVCDFKVGDHVTIEPNITCGHCPACRHGDYGYCENINFTYRVGKGAMADYIQVGADKVYHLPEGMSFDQGALIEPLAVAVHAVRRADIQMGDKVLVVGAGAIGIFVAALAARRGAGSVWVSDTSTTRMDVAIQMGAHQQITTQDLDALLVDPQGQRFDHAFECVGLEQTLSNAMRSVRRNGLVTVIGIFEDGQPRIPATLFASHEIRMQGSQGYCWDFDIAIQMAQQLPMEKMVTHHFALDQVQEAFDLALDRNIFKMKVIVEPEKEIKA